MEPGATMVLRESGEPVRVLAVLDAAGTLLVALEGEEPFQVAAEEVATPWEKHQCGCCG